MAIFKRLLSSERTEMKQRISELLLEYLDSSLENSPLASEEYFNLLTQLLTGDDSPQKSQDAVPKELKLVNPLQAFPGKKMPKEQPSQEAAGKAAPVKAVSEDSRRHFRQVFDRIDGELVKLFRLEQEKKALGLDGFMP